MVSKSKAVVNNVEDRFEKEVVKIDSSSIGCLEFLNDGSLLAVGCESGVIKVVSVAQGKE